MAKLVNQEQRITTGIVHPSAGYSRVVSCVGYIKAPATQGFAYTQALGNWLWLRSVKVWFDPRVWSGMENVTFKILHGTSVPQSYAEITNWTNVLPLLFEGNLDVEFGRWEFFDPLEWEMNRLFEGKGLRFGISMQTNPTVSVLWGYASFEISEG
ncbi:hypothetical protein ES703_19517 [subsurface metagenome]